MSLTIDDNNTCTCGAYFQGNGSCANGHWHPDRLPKSKQVLYQFITAERKEAIIKEYRYAIRMGADWKQAIAIAAHKGYDLTDKQWNSTTGQNAFASACAVLVMAEVLMFSPAGACE